MVICAYGYDIWDAIQAAIKKMQRKYYSWEECMNLREVGDVMEANTLVGAPEKSGMGRDWHVCNIRMGQTIIRATSVWVMLNKNIRRLSKMPEEFRAEIGRYNFVDRTTIIDEDNKKLLKLDDDTADYIRKGLSPRWGDLDVNQHVNNVKYIGCILKV